MKRWQKNGAILYNSVLPGVDVGGVLDAFLLLELCRGRLRVALPRALQRDVLAPGRAHAAVHVTVRDDLWVGGVIQSHSEIF